MDFPLVREALQEVCREVWERIPLADRVTLELLDLQVFEHTHFPKVPTGHGWALLAYRNGKPGASVCINTESPRAYWPLVVAHEMAHVTLRHVMYSKEMVPDDMYSPEEWRMLKFLHEEQVGLQILCWKMEDYILAAHRYSGENIETFPVPRCHGPLLARAGEVRATEEARIRQAEQGRTRWHFPDLRPWGQR